MYCQGQILHLTEAATGGETGTDPSDPSDELFPGVLFGLKVEEICVTKTCILGILS